MKEKVITFLITVISLWIFATNIIQAFKCPEMSQTELLIHAPKSAMLKFNKCK